jgi:hypothetical protein
MIQALFDAITLRAGLSAYLIFSMVSGLQKTYAIGIRVFILLMLLMKGNS